VTIRRKLYVVTTLSYRDVQDRFKPLWDQYLQTENPAEAEFVVFDLARLPSGWAPYVGQREGPGVPVVAPPALPCFILKLDVSISDGQLGAAAVGGRAAAQGGPAVAMATPQTTPAECDSFLKEIGKALRVAPRIHASLEDLLEDLRWFEHMFPFHREVCEDHWLMLAQAFVLAAKKGQL
jgi:hypothetical protein